MAPLAEELSSPARTEASACAEEAPWDKDAEIASLSRGIAAYRKSESRMNEAMKCMRERMAEGELRVAELETALAEERRLRLALEDAASAQEPSARALAGEAGLPEGTGCEDCGADLEAQVQELQLLLANREALLSATRAQLAEREGRLAETKELLKLLAESELRIVETEALLVKRDERIAEAEVQLRTLRGLTAEQAVRIAELEQRAAASGGASPVAAFRRFDSSGAAAPAGTPPTAAAAAAAVGRATSPPLVRTEFVATAIAEAFKSQPPSTMAHSHAASAAAVATALHSRPPSPLARREGSVVAQAPPPWQPAPAEGSGARASSPLPPHRVRRSASVQRGAGGAAQEMRVASPLQSGHGSQMLPPGPGPFAAPQELRAASPVPNGHGSQTLPAGPVPGWAASLLDTSAGCLREFTPQLYAAGGPVLQSLPSLPSQELSPLRAARSLMLRPQRSRGPPADGIPPPWAARVSWA